MKYFSMFTGIGGFELGIQQAYEFIYEKTGGELTLPKPNLQNTVNENERREQTTCIGYSETDKYAIQIYEKHFKHKNYGDCTTINPKEIPDHDLLVGGFPCQAFSIAGKRKGFNDTRGTLFFDIARILKEKRPRYLLLENVKGLLSHDKGNTFKTILSTLTELGYDLQWQVLNSKNFGVPQNRERVFIIGHLRGTGRPQVFPFAGTNRKDTSRSRGKAVSVQRCGDRDKNTYSVKKEAHCLASNPMSDYLPKIIIKNNESSRKTSLGSSERDVPKESSVEANRKPDRWLKDGTRENKGTKINSREGRTRVRRLTPTECERLQGFPDGWTEGISDTQRYKTLGNAVTVNVIREIMTKLLITTY